MPLSSHRTQTVHLRNVLAYSAQLVSLRRRNARQIRPLCRETRTRRWRPACKVACDAKLFCAQYCSLFICFMLFSWHCCTASTFLASWLYWPTRCSMRSHPTLHIKSYVIEMTAYMCTISAFVRAYLLRYMIHRVLLLIALFSLSSVVMSRQHLFLSSTRHNQWCFSCTAVPPVALRLYC